MSAENSENTKIILTDTYWPKRLHTIVTTGNVAALVLLATYMGKQQDPIIAIQSNTTYFIPFLIGLVFSFVALIVGVDADHLKISNDFEYKKSKDALFSTKSILTGKINQEFRKVPSDSVAHGISGRIIKSGNEKILELSEKNDNESIIESDTRALKANYEFAIRISRRLSLMTNCMYTSAACFLLGIVVIGIC